jgi:demethylmenaquinone methyltransferase/2-methoxy-6-polyprenyl-1,4-benzoquinol methylase
MPRQRADATTGRLQAGQVRAMFDRIAGVYDPLNTAMTAGLHHRWRARAADLARVGPGSRVLDVATGTGDLAIELARRVAPGGEVVGSDFSERMLDRARAKSEKLFGEPGTMAGASHNGTGEADARGAVEDARGGPAHGDRAGADDGTPPVRVRFEWGDALQLPYPDDSFDAATVGFGARNFSNLSRGLAEMARVVRPGGRVVVLDFTPPRRPPLSLFYGVWFDRVVPLLGRLTAPLATLLARREKESTEITIADAYAYLPSSVRRFLAPEQLAAEMQRAGMSDVRFLLTAGGIVTIHAATVPL